MFWAFKIVLFSVVFIWLIHHLLCFFKETLTVPKVKDMVKTPSEQYRSIFKRIEKQMHQDEDSFAELRHQLQEQDNLLNMNPLFLEEESQQMQPIQQIQSQPMSMKDELKMFLKAQMNK